MRLRLLLVFVGVVAVVLLAHDVPLAGHLERVERDRLATKLERDAFILAGRVEEALEDGTAGADPAVEALVARYSATEGVRVVVVDDDAIGVAQSEAELATNEDFSNRPEFASALGGEPATGQRTSVTLGEDLFYVAVPVLSGDDVVGAVRLSAPERVVDERADERVRSLFVVAGISVVIAVAVALLFAVYVTRPLQNLRTATVGLAEGDLDTRADVESGPPEIRELASSFNAMADRLERLVDQQRRFAGTASHQLRTPLTALRLRLDQLSARLDDDAAADQVAEAVAETERLRRIVEGLLALSRAEASTDLVHVDLTAIVHERVAAWRALADERGVHLETDLSDDAHHDVLVVGGAVEQIVDNLLDNALEVSPSGSELTVRITPAGDDTVQLHVIDQGPGLTAEQRTAAFDRFWQNPDITTGGTGLGLPIVRELAHASGGDAELCAHVGGGIDAAITFRRAPRDT